MAWASTVLATANFIILPNKHQSGNKQNSSFHRIDSEVISDASDDSDVESELNTSLRSNLSSFSKRSWDETKLHNSTLSSDSTSMYSHSLLPQRSYAASTKSVASLKLAPALNKTFAGDRRFNSGGSQMGLAHKPHHSSQTSFNQSEYFPQRQCLSRMSLHSMNKTFTNGVDSVRSPSRNSMYEIPNDFESGLTRLNLNTMANKAPAHVFGSSDAYFGDMLRHRKTVLTPSRLIVNEPHHALNQSSSSSWLAGGFWNSTSPQKKSPHHMNNFKTEHHHAGAAKDLHPLMSRASSKSSGFESRENSLCDDTETPDRTFIFPEPAALTQHSAKTLNGFVIKPQPHKPAAQPLGTHGNWNQPAHISSGQSEKSWSNCSMLSQSMSQFSLQPKSGAQQLNAPFQTHNQHDSLKSDRFTLNLNQFDRFNNDSAIPKFQRGSLIKLHDVSTDDHN